MPNRTMTVRENIDCDKEKVDQATLALMWLVTESDKYGSRAWKGFDWDT